MGTPTDHFWCCHGTLVQRRPATAVRFPSLNAVSVSVSTSGQAVLEGGGEVSLETRFPTRPATMWPSMRSTSQTRPQNTRRLSDQVPATRGFTLSFVPGGGKRRRSDITGDTKQVSKTVVLLNIDAMEMTSQRCGSKRLTLSSA